MSYEYGCIIAFGEHEVCDTEDTLTEAMWKCKCLQREWDRSLIGCWKLDDNEWRAASDNPHEPWYVRAINN